MTSKYFRPYLLATGLVWLGARSSESRREGAGDAARVVYEDAGASDAAAAAVERACTIAGEVDAVSTLGCKNDFLALASVPIDATIPGSRSAKVVLGTLDGDKLYFQNSQKYPIHYQFVSTHLSGGALPVVPQLSLFNSSQYYEADRRFVLGAVTHYEGPDAWVFELAPYDTASAEMIAKIVTRVRDAAYFGPVLAFHPTSDALLAEAKKLPTDIRVVSTDELFAGTDFQPLTLGKSVGRLHFVKAAALANEYLSYRDIIVLDEVPNDITVVSGLITEQFQTPLSHVNVLSNNRGTPNVYGPKAGNDGWYAMDVEFKFDDEEAQGLPAALFIKQARPHPGRGLSVETD